MENIAALHLVRPEWLLVLPFWLLLVWWFDRHKRSSKQVWKRICAPELLQYLLRDREAGKSVSQGRLWTGLSAILGGLVVLALSGPTWKQLPQPVFKKQTAWAIVMDLSRSMDAEDKSPSRLVSAQRKIEDFLKLLDEGQVGLIVFAGSAFDVIPLTSDRRAILAVLNTLEPSMMPVQGSLASTGLKHALAMFDRGKVTQGSVLLVTDGTDTAAQKQAKKLAAKGHRVYVLGVGTPDGAPIPIKTDKKTGFLQDEQGNIVIPRLQEQPLMKVATVGNGSYQKMRVDDLDIQSWINAFQSSSLQQEEKNKKLTQQWQEEGPWLLLLIVPFLLFVFRRGFLQMALAMTFAVSIVPAPSHADENNPNEQHWFLTKDQLGQRFMGNEQPEKAAALFENKAWKAAALYRAGQYEAAATALADSQTADDFYNRGNALVKSGRIEEAMVSYQAALELSPEHEDAHFNLDIVQKMKKNKQEENQQQGEPGKENNKDKSEDQQVASGSDGSNEKGEQSSSENKNGKAQQDSQSDVKNNAASEDTDESHAEGKEQTDDAKQAEKKKALDAYSKALKEDEETGGVEKSKTAMGKETNHDDAEKEDSEQNSVSLLQDKVTPEEIEQRQAQQQWLRKIPDDPGGLLRRKFRYQYQQQVDQDQLREQVKQPW